MADTSSAAGEDNPSDKKKPFRVVFESFQKSINQGLPSEKIDVSKANKEEADRLDTEAEYKKEQLHRFKSENKGRRNLRNQIFCVTVLWMFSVLAFVVLCSMGKLKVSDSVEIALITTTTANVFGFFYVVVNYLFNKEKST